ncbi:tyrosine-protein kinase receptor Tie-1-like [Strongylocentrotus purpuratus]|uniref:Fibronectin type-III domain-containing protein n=1 Tax=Strongylocentrotus purpuratus TaxID=7668 RepID=A0A7M7PMH8_STRPU|nr:tyrosine-protein kinase receptor Tie-1-like [Strongylocentrotus purpuratus]
MICTLGTYGPGCSQTCHCAGGGSSCDIYSGICTGGCQTGWSGDNCQVPDECEAGYYGSQCTDKCHCLNDEPCDKDTGECPEQKCALGYKLRSGQVNCQECEGDTFGLDCLQQCHCAQVACETERGLCKGQCLDSWIEPYCSQRISRLVPVRVNPYQPSSFTCYVEGIPLPDASSVDLYRRTGDTNNMTGITMRSSTVSGSERAVVFDVDSVHPQEDGDYVCSLFFESLSYPRTPITNATYVLPVIENAPVIVSTTSTTVDLRWNEWSDENDVGDPPLVGYDVFVEKDGAWVTDQRVDQLTTSAIVSNLTPDTDSRFRVAAVREGTGGTGPVSPSNSIITRCRKPSASPTGLQVSAINLKELEVIWEHLPSESAECRSGVTNYMIYYAPSGSTSSSSILVFRDTSSYTIRGLDTYLDYTIQLTASNKDEESDRSHETIGKTLEEVAPAPINVAIPQSTTSSFTVSWSTPLPSNINGNIQKYIIRYQQTDPVLVDGDYKSEEVLNGAFKEEHTVVDLPREINYTVQVQTVNGAGSSNWSEPVNAKTILSGDDSGTRKPLSAVIGGVIVPIALIAILLITLVMYRRIKQRRLETEPAASPPNNARETSSKYENPVFDDSKQDPNTYEDPNADTHVYQDLNTDTPNYQNLTDPHTYQDLKKPNTDVTYLEPITSDPGDTYEEI